MSDDEKVVRYIGCIYRETLSKIKKDGVSVREKNPDELLGPDEEFIFVIDRILYLMDDNLALIIRNDYLSQRESKWYLRYFSKSTYYRLREKAVSEFVRCVTA